MDQTDLEFKNRVKLSFTKAKEDINRLEIEIKALRAEISSLKEDIKLINVKKEPLNQIDNISIGNQGVCADRQTDRQTHVQTHNHINISNFKSELEDLFLNKLTKQEFLIFLTIYQLEEQKPVTYKDLSKVLQLSPGCIRTHVTSLFTKEAPLTKSKYKNKVTLLSISQEFKDLNLKEKLMDLFYHLDSEQKTPSNSHF